MELLLIRHALPVRIDEGSVDGPGRPGPVRARARPGRGRWPTGWPTSTSTPLWCSPMRRARETAAPRGRAARPRRSRVDDGLAEFDREAAQLHPDRGAEGGRRPALERGARAARALPAGSWSTRSSGIVAAHPGQRVAVVCHGGVINAYAAHVLGIDDPLFFLPTYTSISRVLRGAAPASAASPASTRPPTSAAL